MKIRDIPVELILNIVISQLFFAAASSFIEITKTFLEMFFGWFYNKYIGSFNNTVVDSYSKFIRPGIMLILFLIFGIALSIVLFKYSSYKKEKDMNNVKTKIKETISQDNIVDLLKHYIIYYENTKDDF